MTHTSTVLVGITDHLDPELQAMLLAQYSRNYGAILERVPTTPEKLANVKAAIRKVYNGDSLAKNYGHKSVGQLGHTTIFFEGISMLAAIALEVSELFNGQESSTRYIDFTTQPTVDGGDAQVRHWQELWRLFYKKALEETIIELKAYYPPANGIEDGVYERTIKARAFDICGGILPAGFTTNVGFTGSFDVLNDALCWMAKFPLQEVRDLAKIAADGLMEKYPNAAFSWDKIQQRSAFMTYGGELSDTHIEAYYYRAGSFEHEQLHNLEDGDKTLFLYRNQNPLATHILKDKGYPVTDQPGHEGRPTEVVLRCSYWDKVSMSAYESAITTFAHRLSELGGDVRSKYQTFPRVLSNALRFRWNSLMDFRSYRDIHRHRNGNRPLPLLTMENGIHCYYLENLNEKLRADFRELFYQQREEFQAARLNAETAEEYNRLSVVQQYAIPMAAQVPYYYECDLNQVIYMQELRTDKTVHQTARIELMAVYDQFRSIFPGVKVHADLSVSNFTLKRGTQTFTELDKVL